MRCVMSIALATLIALAPCASIADPDLKLHAGTVTASTAPHTIVWMRADAWQRAQKDAIKERGRRITAQGQTARCLAGLASCNKGRAELHGDIATETALRVSAEDALERASQTTLWEDAIPWLMAGVIAGAFVGGVALGLEVRSEPK